MENVMKNVLVKYIFVHCSLISAMFFEMVWDPRFIKSVENNSVYDIIIVNISENDFTFTNVENY